MACNNLRLLMIILIVGLLSVGCGSLNVGSAPSSSSGTAAVGEAGSPPIDHAMDVALENRAEIARVAGGDGAQQTGMSIDPSSPAGTQGVLESDAVASIERKIIKNARIEIQVDDLVAAVQEATQTAGLVGGYVAQTRAIYPSEFGNTTQRTRRAWITVRIPVEQFETTLQRFRELGTPLDEEIYTNDVTAEFIDLEARITNLTAQEEQLRRLLAETSDIGQIITIHERLSQVRSEIDQWKGRLRVIENNVAYSTIELTFVQPSPFAAAGPNTPVLQRAWQRLMYTISELTTGTIELFIWVIGNSPYLVVAGVVAWLGWRRWRQLRPRNDDAPANNLPPKD